MCACVCVCAEVPTSSTTTSPMESILPSSIRELVKPVACNQTTLMNSDRGYIQQTASVFRQMYVCLTEP